jgi:Pyridoxamine 5'-phosphate oxidase
VSDRTCEVGTDSDMAKSRMDMAVVPDTHQDLLEQPVIAHLATARPDGALQSNPVWFEWDGEHIKISQTRDRQRCATSSATPTWCCR